jgi:hypothetical protein
MGVGLQDLASRIPVGEGLCLVGGLRKGFRLRVSSMLCMVVYVLSVGGGEGVVFWGDFGAGWVHCVMCGFSWGFLLFSLVVWLYWAVVFRSTT